MKVEVRPVSLPATPDSERLVKHGALLAFRALRAVMTEAKKAPSLIKQARTDIREAWAESSLPNV